MVQDGGKKKKNKNKNKKKQQQNQENNEVAVETQPQQNEVSVVPEPVLSKPAQPLVNGNANKVCNLTNLAYEAAQFSNYNWAAIQEAEERYQIYLASKDNAKKPEASEDFDLFASDEEPAKPAPKAKPAKAEKKQPKQDQGSSSLAAEIAKARQHIKNSLECVDGIAAIAGAGASADVVKKLNDLELENKNLKQVTNDLKAMVLKLENRVAALEKKSGVAAPAPAKAAAPAKAEESDDDDVDLFGSDEEEENDDEKNRVREERLAAYHAKKAKKPQVIAKTSVVLDIKPWDDETDMDAMLKEVKTIQKEGLVWGASKLVPVGYGINKLRIMCVVEDEKVSIDELQEQIAEFEDFVQSVDIDSMQKI